jgi:hypothetical protein
MNADQLRAAQAPLKTLYKDQPAAALRTLHAQGRIGDDEPTVRIETGHGKVLAGLHPATGGSGDDACSGDMLLESLAARGTPLAGTLRVMVDECLGQEGVYERR